LHQANSSGDEAHPNESAEEKDRRIKERLRRIDRRRAEKKRK
jgi:hypothetical protein